MGAGNISARTLLTHSVAVLSDREPEAVSCIGYIVAVSKTSKSVGESMAWPGGRKTGRGSLRWRLGDPWVPAVRWQHVPWAICVGPDPLLKPKLFVSIKQVQSHAIRQVDEAIVPHCQEDRVEELYAGDREEE